MELKKLILDELEKNARLTNGELAIMLGVTEDEINAAVDEMEKNGIILGYKALVNRENLDDNYVCAYIELKVTPEQGGGFDKTADEIMQRFPFVRSVYLMSGGFDLLVVIEGLSMKEIALFVLQKLAPLDNVISTSTHFVLNTYKKDGKLVNKDNKDERGMFSF